MISNAITSTETFTPLIQRCKMGDAQAQQQLYNQYAKAMYYVAYRITQDHMDAEDVLQESFVRAFKHLNRFEGKATFGAWLKRIVINTAINHLKKRRMERLEEGMENSEWVDMPAEIDEPDDTTRKVRKAIQNLPDGYRHVLKLYLIEGYDHAEIGSILGISEATSKSQFCRAKKKLRQLFDRDPQFQYKYSA